jgi:hypothetical protein
LINNRSQSLNHSTFTFRLIAVSILPTAFSPNRRKRSNRCA